MNGPLRAVFGLAVLAMWALFGFALARGEWSGVQWGMLALAHLACAIVFVNFPWIFSYGYAGSVVLLSLWIAFTMPSHATRLVAGATLLFGLRLLWHLRARGTDPSYAAIRARSDAMHAATPLGAKLFLWIMMSWLMTFHAMTAYNVGVAARVTPLLLAGVLVMVAGLSLEAAADAQKLAAKRIDAGRFVAGGLYRRVRHPNYLGEIVFQLGLVLTGLGSGAPPLAMLAGVIAPLYVVALMWYAAEDLDEKQLARYGADAQYRAYRSSSARLIPGIA
mgnify:CR=1 FL=1